MMHLYTPYGAARGLKVSQSRAVCVHAVMGVRCPDFGRGTCQVDAPRPFAKIMDHRVLYRLGNERVLLTEPYIDVAHAEESASVLAEVLRLKYAVGEPGSGPWASSAGQRSWEPTALVPISFARVQSLADLAVSEVGK